MSCLVGSLIKPFTEKQKTKINPQQILRLYFQEISSYFKSFLSRASQIGYITYGSKHVQLENKSVCPKSKPKFVVVRFETHMLMIENGFECAAYTRNDILTSLHNTTTGTRNMNWHPNQKAFSRLIRERTETYHPHPRINTHFRITLTQVCVGTLPFLRGIFSDAFHPQWLGRRAVTERKCRNEWRNHPFPHHVLQSDYNNVPL